ncbi:30S ribosomal protein S9 [Streptomyces sp. 4N509B]|uniref:30S ribosomal protein S9 n=1 Tax=Streptomyces sp. 4N509B TaxID=3457413 RepID=UPI003FD65870
MAETTPESLDAEVPEVEEYTTESAPEEFAGEAESASARFGDPLPGVGTGRRKEAIARVRIRPGSGVWRINGRTLEGYFPNKVHQQSVNEPFKVLELDNRYDVVARISGGGISGQAGALRLGVARALNEADVENNRGPLKKAGFLTRDARAVERKKAGLKKARKGTQYSKR